jgi:phosphohistidine phosphatase
MKTLYLLRHAKSSWDNSNLDDFDRPLNDRGLKTAPLMGEMMREKNLLPELIVSSPAKRVRQTAELTKESAQIEREIEFDERIYAASTSELLKVASELNDESESIMLVGHNPGFENLVRVLTGKFETMPTAALAVIDLEIESWSGISPECGVLRELLRPKELH